MTAVYNTYKPEAILDDCCRTVFTRKSSTDYTGWDELYLLFICRQSTATLQLWTCLLSIIKG